MHHAGMSFCTGRSTQLIVTFGNCVEQTKVWALLVLPTLCGYSSSCLEDNRENY